MSEQDIQYIVDKTIEELNDRGYLKNYGAMPANLAEELAEKFSKEEE